MTITSEGPGRPSPLPVAIVDDQRLIASAPAQKKLHHWSFLKRVFSESGAVMLLALALYLIAGALLDFRYHSFNGDAVSRLANGFYVLYSRDPHLAAIGFVWNPGTSIADIVPLLFYHLWSPLATRMFAATLVSATCMAGAVYQVRCTFAEWGVARLPRLLLVAFLALNGMIVYYGGNGMSEGLYVFTLVATSRYLLRWIREDDLASLVYSGVALGLCYLARNEAAVPAILGGMVVVGVGYFRRTDQRAPRMWGALTDLTIFEIPFVTSFVGWAVASYVITGEPFGQFQSIYGNASQEKVSQHLKLHARLMYDFHSLVYLAPTIPIALAIAAYLSVRRRDIGLLAPLGIVGGGLAFDLLAYAVNSIQPYLRYFITAVPLEVLVVGCIFATRPALIRATTDKMKEPRRPHLAGFVAGLVVIVILLPSSVTTVQGMFNPNVGTEETEFLGYIFHHHLTPEDRRDREDFKGFSTIVSYLANMHLTNGQVVVDNFSICIPQAIVTSPNPRIFVIPNDRDFQRTLADPLTFHAHYILDIAPGGTGSLNAPNISYPTLWKTGGGFTTMVHNFPSIGECSEYRLFKVTGHPDQAS